MRRGYDAGWMLDKKGEVFAIATGSDATAEHEFGSAPLIYSMTGNPPVYVKSTAQTILAKRSQAIPNVLESRRIAAGLAPYLVFQEGQAPDGAPMAAIGFSARSVELKTLVTHRELQLSSYELSKGAVCSGAWDDSSFAFAVREAKNVEKLQRFHQALLRGDGMFAGLFLRDASKGGLRSFSGVVICDVTKLRPEHRVMMQAAQDRFEAAVRKEVAAHNPSLVLP